jgi:small subunit ribosomal protein S6
VSYYECVFIARQDISAAQAEGLADTFQKVIEDGEGKVTKREAWGLRTLAYKIKKNRKGHYVLFNIDAPAAAVQEMERQMGLNEDILRSMVIRVDELDAEPSVILQNKGERSDRGDRGGDRFRSDRGERGDRGDRPPRREFNKDDDGAVA